jgi:hypothetical protein
MASAGVGTCLESVVVVGIVFIRTSVATKVFRMESAGT